MCGPAWQRAVNWWEWAIFAVFGVLGAGEGLLLGPWIDFWTQMSVEPWVGRRSIRVEFLVKPQAAKSSSC